jgi:prepilin-type N-terminal cleavage/methylation domain-containing protein
MQRTQKTYRGVTLVELLVSMAIGLLVLGAAGMLFKNATDISVTLGERADMQQNARAGINAMIRDVSLASTDLPAGGILLPQSPAPLQPRYGCTGTGTAACYLTNGANIFKGGRLYYVNPHTLDGAPLSPAPIDPNLNPDTLVVAYADPNMQLGLVDESPTGDKTGSAIVPRVPPANISSPANGLQAGDLIWIHNKTGDSVGDITAFDPATNIIRFDSAGDPLLINQPGNGTLAGTITGDIISNLAIAGTDPPTVTTTPTAQRIFLVTYFIQVDATGKRLLMRQLNAHPATPIAQNVENLQVSYDTVDTSVSPPVPVVNQRNPASDPVLIRKVNIALTVRTSRPVGPNGEQQRLTLTTSVTPRNMSLTAIF